MRRLPKPTVADTHRSPQDYERISKIFKNWYGNTLENKEHALRGWNWGKADFGKAELSFNVQNRPAFEVPYSEISNTNLAGRNEVAVEFSLPADVNDTGTNGHLGGARGKGKKAGAGKDQLVEMRFYVPGTVSKKEVDGEDAGSDAGGGEEDKNAVTLFYETLMEKAEIGETAGDAIAQFLDCLHLTPRYALPLLPPLPPGTIQLTAPRATEDGSTSTCTTRRFASAGKHMTTRSNTRLSRSLWCFPSLTMLTS